MNYQRLEMKGPDGEIIKGKTPVRGANPYVDDYVGFTWNNVHSSAYNCFIENTGHLEFVGAPDFSNNFVSPAFQTRTYYTGMQNSSKKFSLNLVFYQLTLQELNAAFRWLDRTIVSDLFFDYEPYWKYSCKLASISAMEKYVTGRTMYRGRPCDLYLCKVAIQFETVYHPEAISTYCAYKYSDDQNVEDFDFHSYSRNTGSEYMPFMSYGPGLYGSARQLTESHGDFLQDNNLQSLSDAVDVKDWRPMILMQPDADLPSVNRGYWRFVLYNPSAYPTYFKLHLYNIRAGVSVYQYWNNDYFGEGKYGSLGPVDDEGWVKEGVLDIDAYENSACICNVALNLDDDIWLDLHYNSEDGTVLCANQLVEQLRSGDGQAACTFKESTANVYLPGAVDSDNPSAMMLEVSIPFGKDTTIYCPSIAKNNVDVDELVSSTLGETIPYYVSEITVQTPHVSVVRAVTDPPQPEFSVSYFEPSIVLLRGRWTVLWQEGHSSLEMQWDGEKINLKLDLPQGVSGNPTEVDWQFDCNGIQYFIYDGPRPEISIEYDTYEYMV